MIRTARRPSRSALVAASVLAPLVALPSAFAVMVSAPKPAPNTVIRRAPPEICALLDIPEKRNLMDGLLFNLLWSCDRNGGVVQGAGRMVRPAGSAPRPATRM